MRRWQFILYSAAAIASVTLLYTWLTVRQVKCEQKTLVDVEMGHSSGRFGTGATKYTHHYEVCPDAR